MKALLALLIITSLLNAQDKLDLKLTSINNEEVHIKNMYSNGPLLINFWATWCQPCKAEIPHLNKLLQKYKEKGLSVVGINQDSQKSVAKVKSFVSAHNIEYPIVLDTNNEIFNRLSGQVLPYSLLINKDGKVVFKHTGYNSGDERKIEEEIIKLLKP
jgi:cytochrome c biogenesis protein CcmG, thiol:disulfide interchange protein DsbE